MSDRKNNFDFVDDFQDMDEFSEKGLNEDEEEEELSLCQLPVRLKEFVNYVQGTNVNNNQHDSPNENSFRSVHQIDQFYKSGLVKPAH